jgi:acyl-CoA thioesterase-1
MTLKRSVTYGLAGMAFKRVLGGFVAAALLFLSTMIAVAEPYRIVGFGDSLMAGYGLDPGNGFTEKLQAALKARGIDAEVANGSVSGDTTSGGLSRLDWSVPDGTQLVLVELGANDMLRGVTPDITERSLDAILTRLKERKIAVLLVGMRAAPNLGAEYRAAFDGIYPKLAAKHGVTLYPFFLDGVAADPKYLQSDQMHPNAAGVDEIVKRFLPTLEKELAAGPDNS